MLDPSCCQGMYSGSMCMELSTARYGELRPLPGGVAYSVSASYWALGLPMTVLYNARGLRSWQGGILLA